MRSAAGAHRGWGRLARGGVMLIAGALGLGACDRASNAVPYGVQDTAAMLACTTDADCAQRFGADWYCGERDDGGATGICVHGPRQDGGGPD